MTFEQLSKLIGPFPSRVELKPETIERLDCGTYIQEKVEYDVEQAERVSAYFLVPKDLPDKTAAVFCHHQHAGNFKLGKSEVAGLDGDSNQAYARELAERGFIAFAPDAIAFEERNWSKTDGKAGYFELTTRLVQGQTLLAKVLHDVRVGIDYMTARDEVSSDRIGFIGHSYGGRMALWAPVFDRRIKASVSNCGCISFSDSLTRDAGIQMEFCLPRILSFGDVEDVVKMIEPASLLISAADNDVWSRGARKLYDSAKSSFINGKLELKIYQGGHIFSSDMRQYAYDFLAKQLS